jgi:3',5'-cyclic AMP phosphodiesterase CpdA
MVNDQDDQEQLAEVERITARLDSDIPMYWAAGNHDVGNTPTPESLRLYRERYGDDDYSFDHDGTHFLFLNSCISFDPSQVPGEWERQLQFVTKDLQKAVTERHEHILVFVHHPLFVGTPDDDDSWLVIPKERRSVLLELFKGHGVTAVFTGHWHQNSLATDGELQMVTTGPVGYPLGDDPSGFRIVKVLGPRIEHEYYGFDDMPEAVELG